MGLCQTKFVLLAACVLASARPVSAQEKVAPAEPTAALPGREVSPGVRLLGHMGHPRLNESSGVVASRQFPGVFWTHNDGGGARRQVLYAISREGHTIAEFPLTDVLLVDWEDIAIDSENHLYAADVGNNERKRHEIAVYQLNEPDPKKGFHLVQVSCGWHLRFPGEPFDCESLVIWKDHGYVVSKVFKDAKAEIYRFPLTNSPGPLVLERIATTRIDSPVTGADLSPDGKLLALVAKSGAFVYRVHGDLARAGKAKPYQTRFRHEHIEGCTFVPEGLLATAESREIYLFTDPPFIWTARRGSKGGESK